MKKLLLIILWSVFLGVTAFADEYYIGQLEWCTEEIILLDINDIPTGDTEVSNFWCAPEKSSLLGIIDLRNFSQKSQVSGTATGWLLFAYSKQVSSPNLIYLGDDIDAPLKSPEIQKISDELLITLNAKTLRSAIQEILTVEGDPTGNTGWKPIMPTKGMRTEIFFGSEGKIIDNSFLRIGKHWELVKATLQQVYREMYADGEIYILAEKLDYWEEKYGVPYQQFIPDDAEVKIASLPHHTTLTENWTAVCTGDNENPDCRLNWTETSGDIDINGGANRLGVTFGEMRAEDVLSTDDHYAKFDAITSSNTYTQAICRFDSGARTYYSHYVYRESFDASGGIFRLYSYAAGTGTLLNEVVGSRPGSNYAPQLQVDGSSLIGLVDAVSKVTVTDTGITANIRTGLSNGGVEIDNFEAGDLAASTFTTTFENTTVENTTAGL